MELTVIIATRDRRATVCETLARLEPQASDVHFEAVVVDDGSTDDTVEVLRRLADRLPFEVTLIENPGLRAAAARNSALAVARAPVCLFIDDDTFPQAGLLVRHRDFHQRHPEPEAALLGHVGLARIPPPTPFMRWLADQHLGYHGIEDTQNAGGRHFFTGNVSAKTELLRRVGGFDESYTSYGYEDIDLGMRLEEQGMRLAYDREAVVEHAHPTDLERTIERMRIAGPSLARFAERHPERRVPGRPGLRHRVKAAALTALALIGVRTPRVRRETWRFLVHTALRESYWDAVDRREGRGDGVRAGRLLLRLASRDDHARMPPPVEAFRAVDRQGDERSVAAL